MSEIRVPGADGSPSRGMDAPEVGRQSPMRALSTLQYQLRSAQAVDVNARISHLWALPPAAYIHLISDSLTSDL